MPHSSIFARSAASAGVARGGPADPSARLPTREEAAPQTVTDFADDNHQHRTRRTARETRRLVEQRPQAQEGSANSRPPRDPQADHRPPAPSLHAIKIRPPTLRSERARRQEQVLVFNDVTVGIRSSSSQEPSQSPRRVSRRCRSRSPAAVRAKRSHTISPASAATTGPSDWSSDDTIRKKNAKGTAMQRPVPTGCRATHF